MHSHNHREKLLHLRYKPNRENFHGCSEPLAFDHFDWVIWAPDDALFQRKRTEQPKTILSLAARPSLEALLARTEEIKDATIVIAGEDIHLSKVIELVEPLIPHCKAIFYEAKDIRHESIRSFCMGSISYYMNRFDQDLFSELIAKAKASQAEKKGVLAAWGAIWKHLDETVEDRKNATIFVENTPWLKRETLHPDIYITRLMESRFMLAPAGNGIQAPKLAEAWLMRTVPIVVSNPCFEDLQDEGFPFLMLNKWDDLTENLLAQFEEKRIKIDWENVYNMLTLNHFFQKIGVSAQC